MQGAPKYSKIQLIANDGSILDTHNDCGMFITGEKLVVVIDHRDSILNATVSHGIVYSLNEIKEYKTYQI